MSTPVQHPGSPSAAATPGGNAAPTVRHGLRANLAQFSLLVAVNALVGGTLGQERTVVPLLAKQTFHLSGYTAGLTFIVAFGTVKAITNFFAGTLSDRHGRKPVLVAGWLVALPVPALLIWGPSWWWIVAANDPASRSALKARSLPYAGSLTITRMFTHSYCATMADASRAVQPTRLALDPLRYRISSEASATAVVRSDASPCSEDADGG